MKNNSKNPLFHSVSTESTNKFRSIMNSPNFGNQQILLQSCCFYDSEGSQTPNTSNTKHFKIKSKIKSGSPKISYSNGNIESFKKMHFLTDKNEEMNSRITTNSNNQYTIDKLKKHNKALKETIKNLTSQLDRVCNIALKVKNNELKTLQQNNDNELEKFNLLNEIENLKKEKNDLKMEIEKKDEEYKNYQLKGKLDEINNQNKLINNENKKRRLMSDIK